MRLSRSVPCSLGTASGFGRVVWGASLAAAVLVLGCAPSVAAGAGLWPAQASVQVQYRPDGYGPYGADRGYQREQYRPDGYRQDDYRQDGYRGDNRGDRYGSDPRQGYGQDRQDSYGQDRRRPDERGDRGGGGVSSGGPGGSYQQSCRDFRTQGSVLTAVCRDGRGHQLESSIDIGRCGRSDIGNQGGVLACGGTRGNGRRVD